MKKSRAREAKSKIKTWSKLKKHIEKTFLPHSYKQELYLKITSLNLENLKVEEYIREFEQLQMTVGLDEEPELKMARFIKGLSPSIASKVELQPCISFDDVCHLGIKVEKQLKGQKPFKPLPLFVLQVPPRVTPPPTKLSLPIHPPKLLTRVKGLLVNLQRD